MATHAKGLEPHDRLLAAVIRLAIRDLHTGPSKERQASHDSLVQLGLLDPNGNVVAPGVADVATLWVG
jgi:hypothetical protein